MAPINGSCRAVAVSNEYPEPRATTRGSQGPRSSVMIRRIYIDNYRWLVNFELQVDGGRGRWTR